MQNQNSEQHLNDLYFQAFGQFPTTSQSLPKAGSDRRYFRMGGVGQPQVIGTHHTDTEENRLFVKMAQHFHAQGHPVPEVLAEDLANGVYLQSEGGEEGLLDFLLREKKENEGRVTEASTKLYQKSLSELARLQTQGLKGMDLELEHFDQQALLFDLHYFKYYFLKMNKVSFNEGLLEKDFQALTQWLSDAPGEFFLYRDFQARNILVNQKGEVTFIDFQGGKKGPLAYDVASLLFQAKAQLPQALREALLDYYLGEVKQYTTINEQEFKQQYNGFVLMRFLQVMGSYGFRGLHERREYFLGSIPQGLDNIAWWLQNVQLPIELPELRRVMAVISSPEFAQRFAPIKANEQTKLKVLIRSFSYRRGYPPDESGHGGGYCFDCRGLHNPGRYAPYVHLTGHDMPVQEFLRTQSRMEEFLPHVRAIADISIEDYLSRGLDSLAFNFGCTGGRHRSVFAAEQLAAHIRSKYGVEVDVRHIERELEGRGIPTSEGYSFFSIDN